MLVYVRTLTGHKLQVDLTEEFTFGTLKEWISEKEGIETSQIRLIYAGHLYPDTSKVIDTKISAGGTIHMVLSLRGG